ncbi:indolepyruvate ferredoxin oxidoreductase family protein, partial [Mesorhizobium sp. CAU 1732]|uniref:indolepyruvate ferredoxin oxidoreductase family protein n=1 Tax=Mesorhizobium sp. CAU 1732 TaxID=3140358 RepID=UPI003260CB88
MGSQALATTGSISLDDKWEKQAGRIFLNGTQAIGRVLLTQKALDIRAGINTAGFVSGYRGSPLGNVDAMLWGIAKRLEEAHIKFVPGVNEDIAATAVRGTQQLDAVPDPQYDGVFAAWYGKGPGIDRSLDALKHGNFAGSHPNGGVLILYGDDHGGKSSTIAHHSEQAVASALIPSLYPANVGEIIEYGLLGYAMSRFSGSWVGLKLVNEVVEQTASCDVDAASFAPVLPSYRELPPEGLHVRPKAFGPLRDEQIVAEHRLPHIHDFVRENKIDRTSFRAATPRLGLVTAGKSYGDTRQALSLLGLDDLKAAMLGVSLYKVGCIWPLEPTGARSFAKDHDAVFVIEEKKGFIEQQFASLLVNEARRPYLLGKLDEHGKPLLPLATQLEPMRIAVAIADRLRHLGIDNDDLSSKAALFLKLLQPTDNGAPIMARTPYFCSGCPHSRSTRIPDGSLSMTGIGCHTMVTMVRPQEALPPTHMGGEGGNWIGLSHFTGTKHIFQNMGDGTYYHSGLLAIRAAIASGVNITYKILYNDAVAMTGGQPVDGPISVAEIAQQVRHEGVDTIRIVSDNPDHHRGNPRLPPGVQISHRDDLDGVQRDLRDIPGCTVLIYEQTCAAEKRRRRKRGTFPNPPQRLFISEAVCEGCGDCSVQSTCVSLTPLETEHGMKRKIDQSSCNKDFSCLNGFCPSFITVRGAEPKKPRGAKIDPRWFDDLPTPARRPLDKDGFGMMVAGIGGTGVITVSAVIGMAAHIEGLAASLFDMTGLSQKNGAVFSHVRIARSTGDIHSQKLGRGESDVLLAFDLVAALSAESSATLASGKTLALVNSDVSATAAFQFNRDAKVDNSLLQMRLKRLIGEDAVTPIDATALALALLGDSIAANMFMVGAAVQRGLLPIAPATLEQAIALNGTAVEFNLTAFRLGRLFITDREKVETLLPSTPQRVLPQTLNEVVAAQSAHLTRYQDAALAKRYKEMIARISNAEQKIGAGKEALALAVARNYSRLLAYKDEYEVARLLTDPRLKADLSRTFGDEASLSFNLAPPIMGGASVNGRPRKREFSTRWMSPLLSVLSKAKRLRGTAFDPFGYTIERKMERRLIVGYEKLVDEVLERLTADNHAAAVKLLSLADMVRG